MAKLETPLVRAEFSARHATAENYYKLPVVGVYKSHPIYRPDVTPANYRAFLQGQEPELEWDPAKLPTTKADWIRAGEALFDAPTRIGRLAFGEVDINEPYIISGKWWEAVRPTVGGDGALLGIRYVIRKKQKLEIGLNACSMCHARVMPDGFVAMGAPGQFTYDAAVADDLRHSGKDAVMVERNRRLLQGMWFVPWAAERLGALGNHLEMAALLDGHVGGVMSIDRAAPWAPVKVPDLIGVAERKYLGATGLVQQRSIDDLMRFIALHAGGDSLTSFGSWTPPTVPGLMRFSDEQIYALAQYLYSLKPPKHVVKPSAVSKKGRLVFEREGCATCHGEEKLMTAAAIGTDPALTMETRRGTGFYRVPSLTGLWYRGPFGHNGKVLELEHWMDPQRLSPDFFPAGFGGLSGPQGAVKGHEFGLKLGGADLGALLVYLRTL